MNLHSIVNRKKKLVNISFHSLLSVCVGNDSKDIYRSMSFNRKRGLEQFVLGGLGLSYTMIIAEKSASAAKIAKALNDAGEPKQLRERGVTYFTARRGEEEIFVVPAVGHLYTVTSERKGSFYYPVFNVVWKPVFEVKRNTKHLANWIKVFTNLAGDASTLVSGTDFDVEGELIGYTLLKYACGGREREAKRMVFSTLTEAELRTAFDNLVPTINLTLAEAGETRHIVDFLWGVNLSRAITLATRNQSGRYRVLSAGRVQAPTLKFVIDREKEIHSFVPMPYWEIVAEVDVGGVVYDARYERRRLHTRREAEDVVKRCRGKPGLVEAVKVRSFTQNPPAPFNLGALQGEAYRLFRYTPSRTLNIAERLYLDALISYPRTSSQQLPPTINYKAILHSLSREKTYRPLVTDLLSKPRLTPTEGARRDPAHPAIYPTGNLPGRSLSPSHRRLFDLIVRRLFAAFSDPAIKQGIRIEINVHGALFYLSGRRVLNEGWLKFYEPYVKSDELLLPKIEEGERLDLRAIRLEEKYTPPPPRYNPNSLLTTMDKQNIGTKATRASIIDTLYKRGYIREERIEATELGFRVVEALEAHCPRILSVELTRALEEEMARIEAGDVGKAEVLLGAVDVLKDVLLDFREKEELIGRDLSDAVNDVRREALIIGPCPVCGSGQLIIVRSRKTGKQFVGCSNFRKNLCHASFPLPQPPYHVKPVKPSCIRCGWPQVLVTSRGKRPWYLCLNPACPTKSRKAGGDP